MEGTAGDWALVITGREEELGACEDVLGAEEDTDDKALARVRGGKLSCDGTIPQAEVAGGGAGA